MSVTTSHSASRVLAWSAACAALGGWLTIMTPSIVTLAFTLEDIASGSTAEYSLIIAMGWAALIASMLGAGRLSDWLERSRGGRKSALASAAPLMIIAAWALTQAHNWWVLALAWVAAQIPAALILVTANAAAGVSAVVDSKKNASGLIGSTALVALVLGSTFIGFIGSGSALAYLAPALLGALLCVPLFLTIDRESHSIVIPPRPTNQRNVRRFFLTAGLFSTATSVTNTYAVPYVENFVSDAGNYQNLALGAVLVSSVISVVMNIVGGRIGYRINAAWVVYTAGLLLVITAIVVLLIGRSALTTVLAAGLLGLGFGLANGTEITIMVSFESNAEHIAANLAALSAATMVPYVLSPLLGSAILSRTGDNGILILFGLSAVVSVIALMVFRSMCIKTVALTWMGK